MARAIPVKNAGDQLTAAELNSLVDATTKYKNYTISGTVTTLAGAAVWYPPTDIDITKVEAWLGTAGGQVDIVVKKEGASLSTLTIPSGQLSATPDSAGYTALSTDKITVDVTSTSGEDLNVRISYH